MLSCSTRTRLVIDDLGSRFDILIQREPSRIGSDGRNNLQTCLHPTQCARAAESGAQERRPPRSKQNAAWPAKLILERVPTHHVWSDHRSPSPRIPPHAPPPGYPGAQVATHGHAPQFGVLATLNDDIHLARYVRKVDSQLMGAFRSHPGPVGQVRGSAHQH